MKFTIKPFVAALALWFACGIALALTPAEKLDLQNAATTAIGADTALKAKIDALVPDAPPPPPPNPWPRSTPDILDIDLVNVDSVLKAKLLDGAPGWDGKNSAIHYGQMSGDINVDNGVVTYPQKFSNPSCTPRWGVEANGLHYLESCSDMTFAFPPGMTGNRLINWNFGPFVPRQEMYTRYMVNYSSVMLKGQGNIGVKGSGLGGAGMVHIFEIGPVLPAGNWQAQDYFYDAEASQGLRKFNFWVVPDRWYTIEQHVKQNTGLNGVGNRDGVVEWKIDGVLVDARYNALLNANGVGVIDGFEMQAYDGGIIPPKLVIPPPSLRARHARIAICKTTWCGPAPELN